MASKLSMKNLHTFGIEHISESDRSTSLKSQISTLPNPYLADTKRIFNANKPSKPNAEYQLSPSFNVCKRNVSQMKSKQLSQQISEMAKQKRTTGRSYPQNSIIYLLKNESECIQKLKQRIEDDKHRLCDQFMDFNKTICNIMDDLKCTILAELDSQYQKFVDKFRIMKVEYKNYCNIKNEFWSMRAGQIQKVEKNTHLMPGENYRYPGMVNKQEIDNELLLLNFIEDLKECKKHVNYKQFTEIQEKILKPLLFTADCLVNQLNVDSYFQPNATNKTFQNLRGYFQRQVHKLYEKMDNFMKNHIKIIQPQFSKYSQNFPLQSRMSEENNYKSKIDRCLEGNKFGLKERQKRQAVEGQIYVKRKEKSPLQQITNQQLAHQVPFNFVENQSKKPTSTAFSFQQNENLKSAFDFMEKEKQRQKSTYSDKCPNENKEFFTQSQKYQQRLKNTQPHSQQNYLKLEQDRMILDKNLSKAKEQISQTALCVVYLGFNKLAVGTKSGTIKLFCTKTSSKLGEFHGHQSAICSLASIEINNNIYLISGGDIGCCQIICWNPGNLAIHHRFTNQHKAAVTCILDIGDGSNFISGSFDCSINLFSMKKKELIKSFKTGQKVISITKGKGKKNENYIITGNLNSQISVWKLVRNTFNSLIGLQSIRSVSVGTYPYSIIQFTSHSSQYGHVMVAGKDRWVRIVNFEKGIIQKASQLGQFCELIKIQNINKQQTIVGVQSNGKLHKIVENTSEYPEEQLKSYEIGDFGGLTYSCGISPKHVITKQKNGQSSLMIPNHRSRQSEVKIWKIKDRKISEFGSNVYTY